MRDNSAEILFKSFSAGGPSEQFLHGQGCPLYDVDHPAFPLPTTASPTLQGALKDSFGEALVACDMPETCKFPSADSCRKRFLWTHKEADLAPRPVVGLVLQVGDSHLSISLYNECWKPRLVVWANPSLKTCPFSMALLVDF